MRGSNVKKCGGGRKAPLACRDRNVTFQLRSTAVVRAAYGTLMNEQDAHQAAGVIQKPFDYDDLVAQVERATARTLEVALT